MVDWLNFSEVSGSGYSLVSVTAEPNTGGSRTTSITVSGHTLSSVIEIEQEAVPVYINITPTAYTFSYTGGTQQYTIDSNVAWNITSYPNWVTISALSGGSGTTIITVTASTNTEEQDRTASVVVEGGGVSASTVITQEAYIPEPTGYLAFIITSDGYVKWCTTSTASTYTIEYRKNGGAWTQITATTIDVTTDRIQVVSGDTLEFRGDNQSYSSTRIDSTALFEAEGNIMSIVSSSNFDSITALTQSGIFFSMFEGCTGITSAGNLLLPAITLTDTCYYAMFRYCTSLVTPPELPATELGRYCYNNMFRGCTLLTTAPELPATALTDSCYQSMFYDCTSLTTAPDLLAPVLASNSYSDMFRGCTSLNSIKCLATDRSATNCTNRWVEGVSATGTFTKTSTTSWSTGNNGIPSGWTVINV